MSEPNLALADAVYQEAWSVLERLAAAGKSASNGVRIAARAGSDLERLAATELFVSATTMPTTEAEPLPSCPTPNAHWSEETYRALLEALPDAMVVIQSDGLIVLVNKQTERMFGYQREELLGQPLEILVPEPLRTRHVEHRQRYFADPRSRPMGVLQPLSAAYQLFGRRKDGSLFPVEISLSPIRTEQGTLATSVIRDISQRKREEAKFQTLVENIPAVTFIAPLDESIPELYVSPQIVELLGFTQKEWIEDPVLWHRQLHPDDRDRWNLQFAPTCATGQPFNSIYRFIAKNGKVVWVHGSARVVRDAEGKLLFLQGVAFDITSIKEAEQALQQINADLEQRVAERTQELTQSMKELQEKTDELEQFAYVASHDLREPLRTLVNWPQMLAKKYRGQLDEQADDWIERIIRGGERMRRLIEDLSQYSRILRRDQVFERVSCFAMAQEAIADLQAAIEESGGQITLGTLPDVLGKPAQLKLLFQNLIGNAVKFRDPQRPIVVDVAARPEEKGWLLWVKDNGIGIDAKHFKRVFGLGERLNKASQYPGTGFGLAICEKIVAGHRGRIWVESEPGRGSSFFFTLLPVT